jgi:hypothetical protein
MFLSFLLPSQNIKIRTHETIILPAVVYGCETSSLTSREEHRLRVFEKRVLRRIFGPEREDVKRGLRKLHNEEFHDLYSSPNNIRLLKLKKMRWEDHVARMVETRNAYRVSAKKPEGKSPTGRHRQIGA